MTKSEFLQEISSMNRDEIDEYFKKSIVKTKILYPLVIITPPNAEREDNQDVNSTRTNKRD